MAGVGVFVAWIGYSITYYGFDQIRGGNNGFLSLIVPGKFNQQQQDSGTTSNVQAKAAAAKQIQQAEQGISAPLAPSAIGTDPTGATIGGYGANVGSGPPSPAPPVYTP